MTQTAPLIATKLHVPRVRTRRVARPQLIQRLNAGLPFILISAPPGFGKTTLLAEWLSQTERTVCWLSLDEHDNDPARFLHYLIGALRTTDESIGATTYALLGSPELPPAETVMAPLLNDLAALTKPALLVLDDYHVISDMRVHQLVVQLVEFLPESLQIAIASRIDPPLPLPRLRVRGQLIEVRSADLRFTAEQAAAFLNDVMGLALTPDVIDTLEARTEGWIAGLQLAALSLQEADDAQAFMQAFAGNDRHIMDYLADEVLSRQSEAVRRFLLHTSLLDRLCGPVCDAFLADDATNSAAMLEQLERANLFIVPLDNRREWYRYHHLFGSLLRHRLTREQAALVPDLHRRAAQWFGQQGLIEEAINHALAARDYALTGQLLDDAGERLRLQTTISLHTLLGWLQALPLEILRQRPNLHFFIARNLSMLGRIEDAQRVLDEVEDTLRQRDAHDPLTRRVAGLVALDRSYAAVMRGDATAVIEFAQRALAVMPDAPTFDRTNVYVRLGVGYGMAGRLAESLQAYEQARAVGIASGTPAAALMPLPNMVMLYMMLGQLRHAHEAAQQGVQLGQSHPALAGTLGIIHNRLSELHYEQNDLAQAQADLERGLELFSRRGEVDNYGLWRSWLAYIREARGDRPGAQQAQQQARQLVDKFTPGGDFYDSAQGYQAWFDLRWGQRDRAMAWAHSHLRTRSHPVDYNDSFAASILLEGNEPQLAADFLTKVIDEATASHNQGDLIKALARRALAWCALRQPDRAFADLQRAIDLAAPEGYVRSILDAGEALRLLLADFRMWLEKQALSAEDKHHRASYTDRLLSALTPNVVAPIQHQPPAQPLVEPLSDRELDVLRLLAEGLTNQEIGQKLYISLPTVKTHTANIYGKLNVNARKDAVLRARALGLLPA